MLRESTLSRRARALVAAEGPYVLTVAVVLIAAILGFFGRYAFDDSYIGYSIAKSLLTGHGFNFNSRGRILSTSAPLAVPLYAAISKSFGCSIVMSAQMFSALSLTVLVFGAYAVARRWCYPPGSAAAAIVVSTSPFTVLLWSHETLLYLATAMIGVNCFVRRATRTAAVIFGLAALFRGEGLLLLPFFAAVEVRRKGFAAGVTFILLGVAPYVVWACAATAYFGAFLSQTIASKQAQGSYPGVIGYLPGLEYYFLILYAITPSIYYGVAVQGLILVCVTMTAATRRLPPAFYALCVWTIVSTLLYVVLRLPFYFWFTSQIGIAMAACAALPWQRSRTKGYKNVGVSRIASISLTCLNLLFLANFVVHPEQRVAHGSLAGVMSSINDNAYRALGIWFAEHAAPSDTIAFAEFGQIHYYSGLDIVDYLGLVTPGATEHLRARNAAATVDQRRPTWFLDSVPWHTFVDPTGYRWFKLAYKREALLHYPGDPIRSTFIVYRLRGAQRPIGEHRLDRTGKR